MSLKSLVVHLDSPAQSKARLSAALDLAAEKGAHVIGLYVQTEPVIPAFAMGQMPAEVIQTQEAHLTERCDEALAAFEEAAGKAGVSYEARRDRGFVEDMPEIIGVHARYADLLVLGQSDPDDPGFGGGSVVDRAVLLAGGPCLVVPYIGVSRKPGRHVLLAWNASREASRAVRDAMPFLEGAEEVTILAVDPERDAGGSSHEPGQDIAHHLARHGVKAVAEHIQSDGKITSGEMLLSRVADSGADLLVMGAYGHARLREIVLGGATRTILQHMTIPVLMSH